VSGLTTAAIHPSDSTVQSHAETVIVQALALARGVDIAPARIHLPDGSHVQVDGLAEDASVIVEAFARQTAFKAGQLHKVRADMLKLALLRQLPAYADTELVIALASPAALESVTGWAAYAADTFGITVELVAVPDLLREQILQRQGDQYR